MVRSQTRLTAEIDFDRDGKQYGFLRLPYSVHRSAYGWIPIPIAQIGNTGGNGSGPRVLLMAGNHGDELEGQVALGKLIRGLDPAEVRGQIIILPSANFPAAMAGMRTSPLDAGNLNRSFPGDPSGGPTAQIAWYIEKELLPRVEFVLDLHSGGSSLSYIPSTLGRRPEAPQALDQATELMRVFGAPIGYLTNVPMDGPTITAAAARAGIRHMSTELAGGGQVTPAALRIAEGGVRRVLHALGALATPPPPTEHTTRLMEILGQDYYCYAPDPGLFEPVELGADVEAGTPAALIHPHDTPWREPAPVAFTRTGTVICKRVPGRVERGDCLFHLASDLAR
jgi:predicted deacylase